jgi:hypothetical protein
MRKIQCCRFGVESPDDLEMISAFFKVQLDLQAFAVEGGQDRIVSFKAQR